MLTLVHLVQKLARGHTIKGSVELADHLVLWSAQLHALNGAASLNVYFEDSNLDDKIELAIDGKELDQLLGIDPEEDPLLTA